MVIGTTLYVALILLVRGRWPVLYEFVFWLIFVTIMWTSWMEERMNLEYWIKPGGGDAILNALMQTGFKEIYRNEGCVLYRRRQRFSRPHFALLNTTEQQIRLDIAEKFEKEIDAHFPADLLYQPRRIPDRRHWLIRALMTSRTKSTTR